MPWLVLWVAGEGVRGVAAVALTTAAAILAAVPTVRPRLARVRTLTAAYALGVRRRGGDALVRGWLAILAGVTAALLVRNNKLIRVGRPPWPRSR